MIILCILLGIIALYFLSWFICLLICISVYFKAWAENKARQAAQGR